MKQLRTTTRETTKRRGTLVPLFGIAILVVGAGLALVLDRIWIDAAQVELRVAAESSALAAGRNFVLNPDAFRVSFQETQPATSQYQIDIAKQAAVEVASQNYVAGETIHLDMTADDEIRFGRPLWDENLNTKVFVETDHNPASVIVYTQRSRYHGNPIALFFKELTGQPTADAAEAAEATWDNRIIGLRPQTSVAIPALPIAILKHDPTHKIPETWNNQIEARQGADNYSFDAETGRMIEQPDGIPEIRLTSADISEDVLKANVQLLDLGTDFQAQEMSRQIHSGITRNDLKSFQYEIRFDKTEPVLFDGQAVLAADVRDELESIIGETRICFLYENVTPFGTAGFSQVKCVSPVCCRVMAVENPDGEKTVLVLQPVVMISRTAMSAEAPVWSSEGHTYKNRYLYNLKLSH